MHNRTVFDEAGSFIVLHLPVLNKKENTSFGHKVVFDSHT